MTAIGSEVKMAKTGNSRAGKTGGRRRKSEGKPSRIRVSVVVPIYEEAASLDNLVGRIQETLRRQRFSFEVVAVDDGSGDETRAALHRLKSRHRQHLVIVRHLTNKGNGAALRSGIRVARGEVVVTMDADGQHAPEDIPSLLKEMPPHDLVIGARTGSYSGSWYRGLANRFYNSFSSWLSRTEIKDLTSGFRAMRRDVALHFLPLFPRGFSAPTTTTLAFLKAGYSVAFVPIHVGQRQSGKSKIRLWQDGVRFVLVILRMIVLFDPLRVFLPLGAVLTLAGLLAWAAGVVAAERIVFPNSAIFLFSTAVLVWLLGFVSDQISTLRIPYYGDETVVIDGAQES
jgi:glycosyltransferase involved in cell wall biosynthesis